MHLRLRRLSISTPANFGDTPECTVILQPGSHGIKFGDEIKKHQRIRSIKRVIPWFLFTKLLEQDYGRPLPGRNYTTIEREYTLFQKKLNDEAVVKMPLLRDVQNSEPDTWWLFAISTDIWFLVDYRGKRFYGNGCKTSMRYWEAKWTPASWKVGPKGRTLNRDWFQFTDLLGLADAETQLPKYRGNAIFVRRSGPIDAELETVQEYNMDTILIASV